jgi:arylsulfatase
VERNAPYLIFHQAANRKPSSAIRWGDYKLVKDWRYKSYELFDLSKDIEEKNDLSKEMPELVIKLNDALVRFLDEANAEIKKTEI